MSLIHHAPPTDSIARFTPDELRAWRIVLRSLGFLRASTILALSVSCVSVPLWFIMDRSDRMLALVILGCGHLALLPPLVIGLILCCFGPAGSEIRRQARQLAVLILAAAFLVLVFVAVVVARVLGLLSGPDTLATPLGQSLAFVALSWLVNVALIGYGAIGLHAALGRDLGDHSLTTRAQHSLCFLASFWIAFCVAAGLLPLWSVYEFPGSRWLALFLPLRSFLIDLAAVILVMLEAFYLGLINLSRFALRMTICEPEELHARGDHPGMPS